MKRESTCITLLIHYPFLPKGVAVVCDAGSAGYVPYQGLLLDEGQRFIVPAAQLEMGFTLPGMIGACVAHESRRL